MSHTVYNILHNHYLFYVTYIYEAFEHVQYMNMLYINLYIYIV